MFSKEVKGTFFCLYIASVPRNKFLQEHQETEDKLISQKVINLQHKFAHLLILS